MADSNATYTRTIAVDLPDYGSQDVKFRLVSSVAIAGTETFPVNTYTLTLDANGEGTIDLPTPDNTGDDAWAWEIKLPDGIAKSATLAYDAAPLQLATWLAAAVSTATPSDLIAVVSGFTDISTYSGHINLRDVGHSPTAGDVWDDGNALHYVPVADERSLSLANGVLMAAVTVADTTTETTVYTETINANELYKGSKWHVKLSGIYSTANANDTFTGRLKMGGSTIRSFTIDAGSATDQFWRCEFFFTVRSTGANGTIVSAVEATTGGTDHSVTSAATSTIDTTVQQDMTLTIQWVAQNVDNSVTIIQGHTEIFGVKQA